MDPVIFVEVLDSRGSVKHRWRCTEFPVRIGRGYRNDVILDDAHVSPVHAQVIRSPDGVLTLEDSGSANGLMPLGSRERQKIISVTSGTRVRVGRTVLRFCTEDQVVPDAVLERTGWPGVLNWIERPVAAWAIIAASIGAVAAAEQIGSTDSDGTAYAVGVGLAMLGLAAVWAGIWSLVGRGVSQRFRFTQHLMLACVAGLAFGIVAVAQGYVEYIFPLSESVSAAAGFAFLVLIVALLFGHLTLVGAGTLRRRILWTTGVVAVLFALAVWIDSVSEDLFSPGLNLDIELKPVGTHWLATSTIDEFFQASTETKRLVDELAGPSGGSSVNTPELIPEQP